MKFQKGHKGYWKGKKLSKEHRKKMSETHKGLNTWMKGRIISEETKKKMSKALMGNKRNLGHKCTEETKEKMRKATKGEKAYNWKGDKVSYSGIHHWVKKWKGTPKICEHCGKTNKERKIWWANKSGEYKRDLNDWISLCVSCHKKYDK